MNRISLIGVQNSILTPDTAEALRKVETTLARDIPGSRLVYEGTSPADSSWDRVALVPGPTGMPPHKSMRGTGRELRMRLQLAGKSREECQELLWGVVIPLGFIPWSRYPVAGIGDDVYHFFGPWQTVYDSLCSEGLGVFAWPSVCAAAQSDVGTWHGDKVTERFIQSQLHRLGGLCGPIIGLMNERTLLAIRSLGLNGLSLDTLANTLKDMNPVPAARSGERKYGFLSLAGYELSATAYGKVTAVKLPAGYQLSATGSGRVIVDVNEG